MNTVTTITHPVGHKDTERVCRFLHKHLNPNITLTRWRRLLDHPWAPADLPRGYMLLEGETLVGFIGTIFARRTIDGKERLFCNMTSWCVVPEHRGSSLNLVLAVLRHRKHAIITNLTPSPEVADILRGARFQPWADEFLILPPLGMLKSFFSLGGVKIWTGAEEIAPRATQMNAADRQLFEDHRRCIKGLHLLAQDCHGMCYVVLSATRRRKLLFLEVVHLGDSAAFCRLLPWIQMVCWKRWGTPFLLVPSRTLPNPPFGAIRLSMPNSNMFLSRELTADKIDRLYSELVA